MASTLVHVDQQRAKEAQTAMDGRIYICIHPRGIRVKWGCRDYHDEVVCGFQYKGVSHAPRPTRVVGSGGLG